ncbi:hypothetical protein [Paenibacillus sp. 1781tsa1]|uniref:hypothetical protein n=1 Tax=Paenibacillus sp. 1781tsa1 TaxID=2953810 RepID=UPI0020A15FE2|nr:hypothetical protein [Paenibacillus sp. 1781tsa1]MCP1187564.1 hypothetical protein [Paenibacillus sp. 1781tsa1]
MGAVKFDGAAVVTAVTTAVTDTLQLMMDLLPLGLTIFAAGWGIKRAMKFFKGTTN